MVIMNDKLYNPNNFSVEDIRYKQYFDKLASVFGNDYEIWIRKEDYSRMLSAGIVNRHSLVAVTIYLKYGSVEIDDFLNPSVIEIAKNHFKSSSLEDLKLNVPVST